MNKRMIAIALMLLALIAVGTVFAATGVSISRTDTTLTVSRAYGVRGRLTGDVCIQLGRRNSTWKGEDWYSYEIKANQNQAYPPYRTNGDTIILNYSDATCTITPEN